LASSLQSLAECQLQIQTSRAGSLDAGVVGLMGVDAAIAASIVGVHGATDLWATALVLICASFARVSTALLIQGADGIGPSIAEVIARRDAGADHEFVRDILDDLSACVLANRRALDRKEPRLANALVLTLIAVLVELASQIH
jgi:hypothetical protein